MPDILDRKERIARKEHSCSYCNEKIAIGEKYEWAKLKSGSELYEWKNHIKCGVIAQELWSYIDPYNGMTEYDFQQGCADFCGEFICPYCKEKNEDCYYCLDKIYNLLQTHDFSLTAVPDGYLCWRCVPKGAVKDE